MKKLCMSLLTMVITALTQCAVAANLPPVYGEVEYIQKKGEAYIDTGIKGQTNATLNLSFEMTKVPTTKAGVYFIGCGVIDKVCYHAFSFYFSSTTDITWYYAQDVSTGSPARYSDKLLVQKSTRYEATVGFTNGMQRLVVGDQVRSNNSLPTKVATGNWYIGARCTDDGPATSAASEFKVFACSIYTNVTASSSVLARNFVPCYEHTTGVYGLYDTVTGTFFTNAHTSGSFTGPTPPAPSVVTPPEIPGKPYTGTTLVADVPASEDYTVVRNDGGILVGSYEVELQLTNPETKPWSDFSTTNKVFLFEIVKAQNTWTREPVITPGIAGKAVPTIDLGEATFGEAVCSRTPAELSELGAGSYTATFTVAGSDNYDELVKEVSFVVLKNENLPEGYLQVEYINTTDGGGEYLDTGVKMQPSLMVEADFALLKADVQQNLIGATVSTDREWPIAFTADNKWRWAGSGTNKYGTYDDLPMVAGGVRYQVLSTLTNNMQTMTVKAGNDAAVTETKSVTSTKSNAQTLYLFKLYHANSSYWNPAYAKLYGCVISTNVVEGVGVKAREYVPCWSEDDSCYGLYDKVSGVFCPSAQSGKPFEGSALIKQKTIVAVPEIPSKPYSGATQVADVPESAYYTVTKNDGGIDVGSYDVILTLNDTEYYSWEGGSTAPKTVSFSITQAQNAWQTEPSVMPSKWISGATTQGQISSGEPLFGVVSVYYDNDPSVVARPTALGTHTITFAVAGTSNYMGLSTTKSFGIYTADTFPGVRKDQQTGADLPDESSVTYEWNPDCATGVWSDTKNWMSATFDCYGIPSNTEAVVVFRSDAVVDLQGATYPVKQHQLRVTSGAKVTLKNGTIDESDVVAPDPFGAEGATVTLENMTYVRDRINLSSEMTLVLKGNNYITGDYAPTSVHDIRLVVCDGETVVSGYLSSDNTSDLYANSILISNAVLRATKYALNEKGIRNHGIEFVNGPDRSAQLYYSSTYTAVKSGETNCAERAYYFTSYKFNVPGEGLTEAVLKAQSFKSATTINLTVDVTKYNKKNPVPIFNFFDTDKDGNRLYHDNSAITNVTVNLTTIPAEVKTKRHARVYWDSEANTLYYQQDALRGLVITFR